MATIRLIPSEIYNGASSYLTISSASNAYNNTDHTSSYATITNTYSSTSSRYAYVRGFNFDDVPANAEVSAFTVKIRGYESGISTNTSYAPALANGTSAISSTTASSTFGTTTSVITVPTGALTWDQIRNTYGSNFGIRVNARRRSRNTTGYLYIQGAEIEVTYTIPNPRTITISKTGNGDTDPEPGTYTYYDGDNFEIFIMPDDASDDVSATNNGTPVTLTHHRAGTDSISRTPTSTFTTGFSSSSGAFYQNASTVSTAWLEYAIGHSAESPYSTSNTSNTYAKPEGSTGWINYHFDFSDIPAGSTISSVSVKVYGAREDSTIDSTHVARFQCYSGNTAKGTIQNFTSTSNGSVTVTDVGTWTAEELHDAQLRFELGYYGGRMLGITWTVTYSTPEYYSYSYEVNGDATIAVVISSGGTVVPVTGVTLNKNSDSIQEAATTQLIATVAPSNATNKSVSWTTSASGVATVNSSGLVTGVSAGTAVITVTTTDGSYTATCTITVTALPRTDYVLTSALVPGKNYIIANGNTGSVYMLSSTAGSSQQLVGVSATVSNGKISLTATEAAGVVFECGLQDVNNDLTTHLKNNNQYLRANNSNGLHMSSTDDRWWHYRDDKLWLWTSSATDGYTDTSSNYKYYLQCSNGTYTRNYVSTTSIQDTTIPAMYLFVESSGDQKIYIKESGSWNQYSKVYLKVNDAWVEQYDFSTLFSTTANYVKG